MSSWFRAKKAKPPKSFVYRLTSMEELEPRCVLVADIEVSLSGTIIADGATSSVDFGSVQVTGATAVRTFLVVNRGSTQLAFQGNPLVEISGSADFSISAQPGDNRLETNGGSTTFQVTFNPSGTGLRTAVISINTNDPDEDPFNFTIRGTGVSSPPGAPSNLDLHPNEDTGVSSSDNITMDTTELRITWSAGANATSYQYGWNTTNPTTSTTNTGVVIDAPAGHGWQTFYVRSVNASGTSSVQSLQIYIDRQNPTVGSIDLSDSDDSGYLPTDNVTSETSVRFNWSGNGNGIGIHHYNYGWNPSSLTSSTTSTFLDTSPPLNNGTQTFYVQAVATSGRVSEVEQLSVRFDTFGPSSNPPTSPSGDITSDSPTISWNYDSAQDWKFEVRLERRAIGSGLWENVPGWPKTVERTGSIGTSGLSPLTEYQIFIRTYDLAGNVGGWSGPTTFRVIAPEIDVLGNGVSIADGSTATGAADGTAFGTTAAGGGERTNTFTIRNQGTAPLGLTGGLQRVRIDGSSAFTVVGVVESPVPAGGGEKTFQIKFAPNAIGAHSATVTILNTDSDEGEYTFTISGVGGEQGPRITSAAPPVDDLNQLAVDHIIVRFDKAIDQATFTIGDVTLDRDGASIAILSLERLSAIAYRVNIPLQTAIGTYTIRIGPDIADTSGNLLDGNDNGTNGENPADVVVKTFVIGAPPRPTNLQVTAVGPTTISLRWDDVIVAGDYFVERSLTANGPFTQIAIVNEGKPNHFDSGGHLTQTTEYFYRVRAKTGALYSDFSEVRSAITLAPGVASAGAGFDYPMGNRDRYTPASDGDGWYDAQDFGTYNDARGKYHLGEDWNAESGGATDYGMPVYAIADGTIVYAQATAGWGNVLIIRHRLSNGSEVESLYGHLEGFHRTSGEVLRGEQIGTVGDGGGLYHAHLHLELRTPESSSWGLPGPGYSATPKPTGWLDPSDFIDAHRSTETIGTSGLDIAVDRVDFQWNSVVAGGGFTFGFDYINTLNQAIAATTVNFYWVLSTLDTSVTRLAHSMTLDLTKAGQKIVVQQSELNGERSPPGETFQYLRIWIDPTTGSSPQGAVVETNEDNNSATLKVVPLVVELVTHGLWSSADKGAIAIGEYLKHNLPADGSALDGRVTYYAPDWNSSEHFTWGMISLFATLLIENSDIPLSGLLADAAEIVAARTAEGSDRILRQEAARIVSELKADYLLPPEQSNKLQRIELVGHSRGAALNAVVARHLAAMGYTNIDYTALDGYAVDWNNVNPRTGVLTEIDILAELPQVVGLRNNFIADVGLFADTGFPGKVIQIINDTPFLDEVLEFNPYVNVMLTLVDTLVTANDSHAPERPGFDNVTVTNSSHLTIDDVGRIAPYLERTFVGRYSHVGAESQAGASTSFGIMASAAGLFMANSPAEASGASPPLVKTGFVDGDIERLGALNAALGGELSTIGVAIADELAKYLSAEINRIGVYWTTTGDVRLASAAGNTSLQLAASHELSASIAQTLVLPARTTHVEFDLGTIQAAAGDRLEVLWNGTILTTIDLAAQPGSQRVSLSLAAAAEDHGEIRLRLTGATATTTLIDLDNFGFLTTANAAPELTDLDLKLPAMTLGQQLATIAGIPVYLLTQGVADADPNPQQGIAVTGVSAAGVLQYSHDDGATWTAAAAVDETHALLLDSRFSTRIRFVPGAQTAPGTIAAITFRAWDRAGDSAAVSGEYADASLSGGVSEFSAAEEVASFDLKPPAAIAGVYVRGSSWHAEFRAYLAAHGLGDTDLGYKVSDGAGQLAPLTWTNVNQISIRFSEDVVVTAGDLLLVGATGRPAPPALAAGEAGFSYDADTFTATWTFAGNLVRNKYVVHLDDAVLDAQGAALDGEWEQAADTTSGDGAIGGDFDFRFDMMPGDVNRTADVNAFDLGLLRGKLGLNTDLAGYNPFYDFNGDRAINVFDRGLARGVANTSFDGVDPPEYPTGAPLEAGEAAAGSPAISGSTISSSAWMTIVTRDGDPLATPPPSTLSNSPSSPLPIYLLAPAGPTEPTTLGGTLTLGGAPLTATTASPTTQTSTTPAQITQPPLVVVAETLTAASAPTATVIDGDLLQLAPLVLDGDAVDPFDPARRTGVGSLTFVGLPAAV